MITATVKISGKRIADLICCAIEGGSGYWCDGVLLVTPTKATLSEKPWYCSPELYEGEFVLTVLEQEDGGEPSTRHTIDQTNFQKAFDIMANKYPHHMAAFVGDNEDAETGDVFLQLATFGEIVYG